MITSYCRRRWLTSGRCSLQQFFGAESPDVEGQQLQLDGSCDTFTRSYNAGRFNKKTAASKRREESSLIRWPGTAVLTICDERKSATRRADNHNQCFQSIEETKKFASVDVAASLWPGARVSWRGKHKQYKIDPATTD